jgi:hypothetical protein
MEFSMSSERRPWADLMSRRTFTALAGLAVGSAVSEAAAMSAFSTCTGPNGGGPCNAAFLDDSGCGSEGCGDYSDLEGYCCTGSNCWCNGSWECCDCLDLGAYPNLACYCQRWNPNCSYCQIH